MGNCLGGVSTEMKDRVALEIEYYLEFIRYWVKYCKSALDLVNRGDSLQKNANFLQAQYEKQKKAFDALTPDKQIAGTQKLLEASNKARDAQMMAGRVNQTMYKELGKFNYEKNLALKGIFSMYTKSQRDYTTKMSKYWQSVLI